jgi:hypothetical protein
VKVTVAAQSSEAAPLYAAELPLTAELLFTAELPFTAEQLEVNALSAAEEHTVGERHRRTSVAVWRHWRGASNLK